MYPYVRHAAVLLSLACLIVVSARDHYETLGIPRSASLSDIKQAFRKLALRYHPDKNLDNPNAEAKFIEIAQAYEVLSDPDRRLKYDEGGQTNQQKPFGSTFNYGGDEFFKGFNGDHGGSAQDIQERLRRKVAEMHAEALRRAHSFANAAAGGGAQTHQSMHEEAMRRHHETIARMQQQQQHRQQQQQPVHASPVHTQQGRNCRVTKTTVGGTTTTTTICN